MRAAKAQCIARYLPVLRLVLICRASEARTDLCVALQVKAITFSHMQIHEREEGAEIFCIVDI